MSSPNPDGSQEKRLVPSEWFTKTVIPRRDIWQMRFRKPDDLTRYADERGLLLFGGQVERLWHLGLLLADFVVSEQPLRIEGLIEIEGSEEEGQWLYADARDQKPGPRGYINSLHWMEELPQTITPYFHPFRYYVLHHLKEFFNPNITPLQFMWSVEGYYNLVTQTSQIVRRRSQAEQFIRRVQKWNDLAALSIAAEPCYLPTISSRKLIPTIIAEAEFHRQVGGLRNELAELFKSIGLEKCESARLELCLDALHLDNNRDVHTILRLASNDMREKLRGRLGGAILVRTMAEVVRRASEEVFDQELPEEDDLEFGRFSPHKFKKERYGSNRIIDADDATKTEYLRSFRLDHAIRVRWYIEGATELGAIQTTLDQYGTDYVQVVDLSGDIKERKKKVLSFRAGLRTDKKQRIFSFVTIDEDVPEYERALRAAIDADEICGFAPVSKPDFEFANFSLDELREVLWAWIDEKGGTVAEREKLKPALDGTKGAAELFASFHKALPAFANIDKGREWGRRLITYAHKQPMWKGNELRPIMEMLREAIYTYSYNYHRTCEEMRTDPQSGRMVFRAANKR